jgi:isoquinoline 1-oxidoreductase beta subunit
LLRRVTGRVGGKRRPVIDGTWSPNPWVRIARNGTITVLVDRSEMGQGVITGLAMLVAEELEVGLDQVDFEFAPAHPQYNNRLFDEQTTGGSTSVRAAWEPLRRAGAEVREMLLVAASDLWGVARAECRAERGRVWHLPTQRMAAYADLIDRAAKLRVPAVRLKEPGQWRLLGTPAPRIEIPDMVTGRTVFGMDVQVPGMLFATVLRCPVFGGRVRAFDDRAARTVPGVREVLQIDSGIAVVGDSVWSALGGREKLEVAWDHGTFAHLGTTAIRASLRRAAQSRGVVAREHGDVTGAFGRSQRPIDAFYETPYLAHAPMEPMNCTAHVRADGCDVWVPTQAQGGAQDAAARICGLPRSAVRVHTTFLGGAFGRRLEQDFVAEAVQVSRATGAAVQVVWTRSDDMQHDFYRPASCCFLRAALGPGGRPTAWLQRIAGPELALDGVDVPYDIPNLREEHVREDPGVPTGPWRSVGASQNAFAVEGFIDELAHAAAREPLAFRCALLSGSPRHRAVLDLAAEKAGWHRSAPDGRARGIAVYRSFGSFVAEVAEVSVTPEGRINVHRVVCAVDCGTVVNPDAAAAQIEGGVIFGLTAALCGEITVEQGRVVQSNFRDYPLLTMGTVPAVEVHLLKSRDAPGGVGEPGVPPVAPAVANALFAATGRRLRVLPLESVRPLQGVSEGG